MHNQNLGDQWPLIKIPSYLDWYPKSLHILPWPLSLASAPVALQYPPIRNSSETFPTITTLAFIILYKTYWLPRWYSGKESVCQCKRCLFSPWAGKIPWRRKWQPAPILLPGKFHGQRSLVGYSPWGHKESDMIEHTYQTYCIYMYAFSFIPNFSIKWSSMSFRALTCFSHYLNFLIQHLTQSRHPVVLTC